MCIYENFIRSFKKKEDKILNIYEQFITYLQEQETKLNLKEKYLEKNSNLEKHHILPFHAGGLKDGPIVICTAKNHTLAHYYRFLIYKELGDYVAYKMRLKQKLGASERGLLAGKTNKKLKNTFWNSKWQSKQVQKGGYKGGAKNTLNQMKARKIVGNTYGFGLNTDKHKKARQMGGLKNSIKQQMARSKSGKLKQSLHLKKFLSKTTVWEYKNEKTIFKIEVPSQESVVKIIELLKKQTADLETVNNANFYNLINGRTSKIYVRKNIILTLIFIIL